MTRRFGPQAAPPREYVEQDWTEEEWTRGFMARWAGTETSPVMNGFIDGAVRSGERVAAEVLAAEPTRGRSPGPSRSAASP
jgi:monoamine oxidase